ncbi:MAG: dTDP-glucose 4,6-dehydratase [Crocinitomicaceae bacterium]|mgnify:CR=1 FL=1|nr:dTDP-glucose 4,6-dehydratase [Crocinitomicaceae bacterium]
MRNFKSILVTGGAGFIGSHVIRKLLINRPEAKVVNLDALTYAGNLTNLRDVETNSRYAFVKGDIQDAALIEKLFADYTFDAVVHLAAESHVDRSIENPMAFLQTNILGTATLLNAARTAWAEGFGDRIFYHISTDEVYGSLEADGLFTEETAYDPRSPYSSSKASSDHLVRSWHHTYGLPVVISNCSNNYGAFQFPEKLIPLMIRNIRDEMPLPIYGEGINVRDWLWVEDHASAIDIILHAGANGRTYNIGGLNEWKNIDLVHELIRLVDKALGRPEGYSKKLITFVKDRSGHDLRYAIDASRIEKELGWTPSIKFEEGLAATVDWYLNNGDWLDSVTSGAYQKYYETMYGNRE